MKNEDNLNKKIFKGIEYIAVGFIGISMLINLSVLMTSAFALSSFYFLYVVFSILVAYILYKKNLFQKKLYRVLYTVGVALIIRLIISYLINLTQQGDYGIYLSVASQLSNGVKENMLYYGIFPHALHYPIFLAGIYKMIGIVTWLPEILNILAAVAEVIFATLLMDKLINPKMGLITGIAIALNPSIILFVLLAGGEPLVDAFILCGLYLLVMGSGGKKFSLLLLSLSGILISIGNFFRPTGIIMIIAIIIFQLFINREPIYQRVKKTAPILIAYFFTTFLFVLLTSKISGYEKADYSYGWNLFVGSNEETVGKWNEKDAELFNQVTADLQDPTQIQKHFADLGFKRYTAMKLGILPHIIHKSGIWIDGSYLPSTVTTWQSEYTKFKSMNLFQILYLICSYYNLLVLLGALIGMFASIRSKKAPTFIKLSSLYMIGIIAIFMLLEATPRYNGAYYGILTLISVYGYYFVGERIKAYKTVHRGAKI